VAQGNTKSYFSALSSIASVAGSEWSFAYFDMKSESSKNKIAVVS
jgi:hypothetical protein